jgi:hypothetical protein
MRGDTVFTVRRRFDVPGPSMGDSVEIGTAETVEELHELLRDRYGVFLVTHSAGTVPIRLELDASVGDDRAFVENVAHAAQQGRWPATVVITEPG